MNLRPQSMYNYSQNGFVKVRAPAMVWKLVQQFWQNNRHNERQEEAWNAGSIFVNHWDVPAYFVDIDNKTLVGGGPLLKQQIWNAARNTLQEWTGYHLADCTCYGIRVYQRGAVLVPHVDRLPLVTSAILNVDQDIDEDEPWPLEVIGHDGKAHNITMVRTLFIFVCVFYICACPNELVLVYFAFVVLKMRLYAGNEAHN